MNFIEPMNQTKVPMHSVFDIESVYIGFQSADHGQMYFLNNDTTDYFSTLYMYLTQSLTIQIPAKISKI